MRFAFLLATGKGILAGTGPRNAEAGLLCILASPGEGVRFLTEESSRFWQGERGAAVMGWGTGQVSGSLAPTDPSWKVPLDMLSGSTKKQQGFFQQLP